MKPLRISLDRNAVKVRKRLPTHLVATKVFLDRRKYDRRRERRSQVGW